MGKRDSIYAVVCFGDCKTWLKVSFYNSFFNVLFLPILLNFQKCIRSST